MSVITVAMSLLVAGFLAGAFLPWRPRSVLLGLGGGALAAYVAGLLVDASGNDPASRESTVVLAEHEVSLFAVVATCFLVAWIVAVAAGVASRLVIRHARTRTPPQR